MKITSHGAETIEKDSLARLLAVDPGGSCHASSVCPSTCQVRAELSSALTTRPQCRWPHGQSPLARRHGTGTKCTRDFVTASKSLQITRAGLADPAPHPILPLRSKNNNYKRGARRGGLDPGRHTGRQGAQNVKKESRPDVATCPRRHEYGEDLHPLSVATITDKTVPPNIYDLV